ncbi:pescadillo homolog [Uranotaenia lowii]|uniref:pescadillo homolog n=1 Tax=Uranotaenia lowii TaxID=190385 RepID=UPI00247AAF02|nr:pescadillo homolog [Uranotaenia lowii]
MEEEEEEEDDEERKKKKKEIERKNAPGVKIKNFNNVLKIEPSIVHSLYKDEYERCIFVKFIDETTGIRGVHLEIAKELPANLFIAHFKVRLFYDGVKNRCFVCQSEDHFKAECPKLISRQLPEKSSETSASYSQVPSQVNATNGAASKIANLTTNNTTLPLKSTNRSKRISPAILSGIVQASAATKLKALTETINSEEEIREILDDNGEDDDENKFENDDDNDTSDDDDNEDDASEDDENDDDDDDDKINLEKINLKRAISSPSFASDKEIRKKVKPKNKETSVPAVVALIPEMNPIEPSVRKTRRIAATVQKSKPV